MNRAAAREAGEAAPCAPSCGSERPARLSLLDRYLTLWIFLAMAGGVLLGRFVPAVRELADRTSIETVYQACAFLPAIGLLTIFLPRIETRRR